MKSNNKATGKTPTSSISKTRLLTESQNEETTKEISPEMALAICQQEYSSLLTQEIELKNALKSYLYTLNRLITILEKRVKNYPTGFLRIHTKGNIKNFYYYQAKERGQGRYLSYKSNEKLIRDLCQKSYDQKVLKEATHNLLFFQKVSSIAASFNFKSVFNLLTPSRQPLVTPYFLPDEDYIFYWKIAHSTTHTFRDQDAFYFTENNERVRSKSEVIIANTLASLGVPYCYEPYLTCGRMEYRPDFIVLNVRTREEFYWEHFGMMDDPDYVRRFCQKMTSYGNSGIIPGVNLIVTFESLSSRLDIPLVKRLIQQFCV